MKSRRTIVGIAPPQRIGVLGLRRTLAPVSAIAAFLCLSLLYASEHTDLYRGILFAWGIVPFQFPFVDTHAVLSAIECHRRGIDVWVENPCDILGRRFVFGPLWLAAAATSIDTRSTAAAGLTLDLMFLASLFILPPPRRWLESGIVTVATLSTMVVFAVERGNIDLAMFVLAVIAGKLAQRPFPARLTALPIVLLAGLLKYYPLAMLILVLRERTLIAGIAAVSAMAALAMFAGPDIAKITAGLSLIPLGHYFGDMFSADNLPRGLATLHPSLLGTAYGPLLLKIVLTGASIGFAIRIGTARDVQSRFNQLSDDEAIFLLIGCVMLAGCFFAFGNVGYRGVHFLFVIPGLMALSRGAGGTRSAQLFAATGIAVVCLMWEECLRGALYALCGQADSEPPSSAVAEVFWVTRELTWWAVVTVLMALVVCFASLSDSGRWARRLLPHAFVPRG